jgi:hypothetical protein
MLPPNLQISLGGVRRRSARRTACCLLLDCRWLLQPAEMTAAGPVMAHTQPLPPSCRRTRSACSCAFSLAELPDRGHMMSILALNDQFAGQFAQNARPWRVISPAITSRATLLRDLNLPGATLAVLHAGLSGQVLAAESKILCQGPPRDPTRLSADPSFVRRETLRWPVDRLF